MKTSIVKSNWLSREGTRLGGKFYCSEGQQALLNLEDAKVVTQYLQDVCREIFIPPRFKRTYVNDSTYGYPYITGSTMLLARPKEDCNYLSKTLTPNQAKLQLRAKTILVTCSGIIGRTVLVNQDITNCMGSPDLLRIIPNEHRIKPGFLYAYLSSSVGQSLITMQTYGSVIDHIEAHHIYNLPISILENVIEKTIHEKIILAWDKRELANELLDEVQEHLVTMLGLEPIDTTELYLNEGLKTYNLSSRQLDGRLDASYYAPPGRKVMSVLEKRSDCRFLGDICKRIFHPFRMNMVLVEKDYGVPFLMGGDIVQFRYFGDKYMAEITDHCEDYLLDKGWILMTRSGTTGQVVYVGDYLKGWSASEHVIRIIPNKDFILSGYLYAFMASEYSQLQVRNFVYGSVVDAIRESQLKMLRIPVPSFQVQRIIHEKVEAAYSLRAEANYLEDEAQVFLKEALGLSRSSAERGE